MDLFGPPEGRSSEFILVRISVRRLICLFVFSEILHSHRNLVTEKLDKSGSSRKILIFMKWAENEVFLSSHKLLSLLFPGSNPKGKLYNSLFPFLSSWLKCFHLIRSQDCLIISISGKNSWMSLIFFIETLTNGRLMENFIWCYYFWLGVFRHAHSRWNFSSFAEALFG